VSFNPDIAAVRARISEARAERAAGQAAGSEQRYIAACFRLDALEVELDRLREQHIRSNASGRRT
jgi:hypothetical protein